MTGDAQYRHHDYSYHTELHSIMLFCTAARCWRCTSPIACNYFEANRTFKITLNCLKTRSFGNKLTECQQEGSDRLTLHFQVKLNSWGSALRLSLHSDLQMWALENPSCMLKSSLTLMILSSQTNSILKIILHILPQWTVPSCIELSIFYLLLAFINNQQSAHFRNVEGKNGFFFVKTVEHQGQKLSY